MAQQMPADDVYAAHPKVDEDSECPACGRPYYRKLPAYWDDHDHDHRYEHKVLVPEFGEEGDDWYQSEWCKAWTGGD